MPEPGRPHRNRCPGERDPGGAIRGVVARVRIRPEISSDSPRSTSEKSNLAERRRVGGINIDTDSPGAILVWKPFCTRNHIAALWAGEGGHYPFDSGRVSRPRCGRSRSASLLL